MGSLRTTTSAIPMARRPEGSLQTGSRTIGANLPASVPISSVSSISRHRSASQGRNFCRISLLRRRCCPGVLTSPQQSIGPPGTPSNTIISHGPDVVSAGNTKYSPTPGIRLNATAVKGFLGTVFLTYVRAKARMGAENGECAVLVANSRATSPFPAAMMSRS